MTQAAKKWIRNSVIAATLLPLFYVLLGALDYRYTTREAHGALREKVQRDSITYNERFDRLERIGCVSLTPLQKELGGCPR